MSEVNTGGAPAPVADSGAAAPAEAQDTSVQSLDNGGENLDAESIDEAVAAGQLDKKEAQSLKRKLKLRVDGQDIEEEVDLGDEAYLTRELQKSKAFDKRVREFATYKKQVDEIMNMLENDPEALLERLGKDVDSIAEKRLTKKLEQMQKSPDQLEREKMQAELENLRKDAERIKKEKEQAQLETVKQQHAQEIERDIKSALSKAETVLPKNSPLVMHRIGQAMFLAMQNGHTNITAADVIPYVEKQFRAELQDLFKVIPEDTIEALIGKEPLDKLRKARIAKAKQNPATQGTRVADTGKTSKSVEAEKDKKVANKRFADFFRFND